VQLASNEHPFCKLLIQPCRNLSSALDSSLFKKQQWRLFVAVFDLVNSICLFLHKQLSFGFNDIFYSAYLVTLDACKKYQQST